MNFVEFNGSAANDQIYNESLDNRAFFSRMSESEVFQLIDDETRFSGKKLSEILPNLLKEPDRFKFITFDSLDPDLKYDLFQSNKFNKKKIQNKNQIKAAILDESVRMFITSPDIKIPTCIPYIISNNTSPCTVYVNLTEYIEKPKGDATGKYKLVDPRQLNTVFALLFSAYISSRIVSTRRLLIGNEFNSATRIYAAMFSNVVKVSNKYLDPITKTKMEYVGSKFFCIQSFGTEVGSDRFYKNISPIYEKSLDTQVIANLESIIPEDSYDSMSELIDAIVKAFPSIKINFTKFFETWVRTYGPASAMLDYPGYIIFLGSLYYFESPMINSYTINTVVSKSHFEMMFSELIKL